MEGMFFIVAFNMVMFLIVSLRSALQLVLVEKLRHLRAARCAATNATFALDCYNWPVQCPACSQVFGLRVLRKGQPRAITGMRFGKRRVCHECRSIEKEEQLKSITDQFSHPDHIDVAIAVERFMKVRVEIVSLCFVSFRIARCSVAHLLALSPPPAVPLSPLSSRTARIHPAAQANRRVADEVARALHEEPRVRAVARL